MIISKWETGNIYIPVESFGQCSTKIGRGFKKCTQWKEVWLADGLCQGCWDRTGRDYENDRPSCGSKL